MLVNAAETLVFLLCELVKGFVALNDSLPGLRRLLKSNWAGPPRIIALCSNLLSVSTAKSAHARCGCRISST